MNTAYSLSAILVLLATLNLVNCDVVNGSENTSEEPLHTTTLGNNIKEPWINYEVRGQIQLRKIGQPNSSVNSSSGLFNSSLGGAENHSDTSLASDGFNVTLSLGGHDDNLGSLHGGNDDNLGSLHGGNDDNLGSLHGGNEATTRHPQFGSLKDSGVDVHSQHGPVKGGLNNLQSNSPYDSPPGLGGRRLSKSIKSTKDNIAISPKGSRRRPMPSLEDSFGRNDPRGTAVKGDERGALGRVDPRGARSPSKKPHRESIPPFRAHSSKSQYEDYQ